MCVCVLTMVPLSMCSVDRKIQNNIFQLVFLPQVHIYYKNTECFSLVVLVTVKVTFYHHCSSEVRIVDTLSTPLISGLLLLSKLINISHVLSSFKFQMMTVTCGAGWLRSSQTLTH